MAGLGTFRYHPVSYNDLTAEDPSAVFSDIRIPYTLTQVEAYYPTNCSNGVVATAFWSVIIDDTTFTAASDLVTFTDPLQAGLFVTRTYSDVTITSLTPGEIVTFVSPQP